MSSVIFYINMFYNGYMQFSYLYETCVTILTFVVPILTMRMFAEERKTGTEQLLLTSPRNVAQIVLGKFFGAGFVILISVGLTFMYYIILTMFGSPNIVETLVSMLGVVLISFAYLSFGMFASSLTENQLISAVISIGFFIFLLFAPSLIPAIADYSLTYALYDSFLIGTLSLADTVTMLSFMAMFIIFTIMSIQRRKSLK